MRITEQMIDAFEDSAEVIGTYATQARDTADEVTITRADIYDGLVSVAPMIAEQAIAGYIEQGARLKEAERLLEQVQQAQIAGRMIPFTAIAAFLDQAAQ